MNNGNKSIGHGRYRGKSNPRAVAIALGVLAIGGSACSAAFSDNFQSGTVGVAPVGWTTTGTNGSTATALLAAEGTNQFLALRDLTSSTDVVAARSDYGGGAYETAGSLEFDIRFNQGINAYLVMTLFASKSGYCASCLQPIDLEFFHNAFNTNTPLLFRSRGNGSGYAPADPNAYAVVTNNFPIGSWQTIRVDFVSSGGLPRGTYSVSWNGITNNYYYLNQGDLSINPNPIAIDRLSITSSGNASTESVDIDNIRFIPEPSTMMMLGIAGLLLMRRNRLG